MARKKAQRIVSDSNIAGMEWFQPVYSETTLVLMAVISLLLLIFDPTLRSEIRNIHNAVGGIFVWFALAFYYGLALCLVHPFLSRRKSHFEKIVMALFVMAANGGSGLYAAALAFRQTQYQYFIFPLINLLAFFFVSISLVGGDTDRSISDENVELPDLFVPIIVLFIVFFLCLVYMKTLWAFTFSMCIAYASLVRGVLHKLINFIKMKTLS